MLTLKGVLKSHSLVALFLSLLSMSAFGEIQITNQPESIEVPIGASASFLVDAITTIPGETILFQWYFNGQAVAGATDPILTIVSVQSTNLGTYWVKAGNLNSVKESAHVSLSATIGINSEIFPAVELDIPTQAGRIYLIQSSPDLLAWSPFADPIAGTGGHVSRLISSRANAHTFYRVLQRLNGAAPLSLNGITIVTTPVSGQASQIGFSGTPGGQTGSYHATGGTVDDGSYSYSTDGVKGTLIVSSIFGGGVSATFLLDFSTSHYTKSFLGSVIETGSFSY